MKAKKGFVEIFEKAVKAADPDIYSLDYYAFEENGEEFVDVIYKKGCIETVCVTGDSFNGIMKDVLYKII